MRRAFGDGGVTLVLIGDPKQAIYAFRGADVYAYLEAANRADKRATLEVNWRSDQGLIDAYDALLGGAKLGHEGIVYRTVRAADANRTPRLSKAPVPAPLRIRVVDRGEPTIKLTRGGLASNATAREYVAQGPGGRPRDAAVLGRADRDPRAGRHGATPRAHPPRPRRGARENPPQRRADPRRPRRGRHPRGHQRRGQRLRHRAGPRLAAPARGDRTAVVARARSLGRADAVPGLDARSGSRRPPTRTARSFTGACTSGRACCASRASRR